MIEPQVTAVFTLRFDMGILSIELIGKNNIMRLFISGILSFVPCYIVYVRKSSPLRTVNAIMKRVITVLQWILATVIVFFASVLQAATGFGFSIMATPFLLLVFDSRECVQISIILSFVVSLLLIRKIIQNVDKGLLWRLIIGSVVGIPLGIFFYKYVNIHILKVTVSIVILIVTLLLMKKSFKTNPKSKIDDLSDNLPANLDIPAIKKIQFFVGFCAGLFTTSIGMPGVPLILYYNATNTIKEKARSTTLVFFIFVYIISFGTQLLTVKTNLGIVASALGLIPVVAGGVFMGNILFDKINQITFQRIAYGILLFTGFYMSIKSFWIN
ncbi:sulfite exporter TauE/SafE family protein [Desulfosporosinus sp.]|uniref:sulfite exporter TauE/SafE family protein n=1 Tax=Desulfosporosinus sp. TaxID=157907 RepID=UPI0025BBF9D9|nr:sulfite exporter TauE/SafE family protein [Desulfosporosinus sp.]